MSQLLGLSPQTNWTKILNQIHSKKAVLGAKHKDLVDAVESEQIHKYISTELKRRLSDHDIEVT